MHSILLLLFFIALPFTVISQSVIADHTIVDDYDIIPQEYIDSVKKMWVTVPGESHSLGYRLGLQFLENQDNRFQVSIMTYGTPEPETDQNLRFSRATWGDLSNSSGWVYNYGEEDWFTSATAVERTRAGIQYANENGYKLSATGFGWCWDMSWNNGPSGDVDPVYQTRWAGTTSGGPDGDRIWGLDAGDNALTENSVNMDTYLNATEDYISLCEDNNYATKVFFTTGPVDANSYNTGERGYQRYIKTEYIRNYVINRGGGYLFDYADILSWNDEGEQHLISWTDWGGVVQNFEFIHPDNMIDLNGSYSEDGDHIGQVGSVRLAKAMWWMLARMAGWNGLPEGTDNESPTTPSTVLAQVLNETSVQLSWNASTDNVGVNEYTVYRDDIAIGTAGTTIYTDNGLDGTVTYSYRLSATDAAGNESLLSDPVLVNTYDSLGMGVLNCTFVPGFNWLSLNIAGEQMDLGSVFTSVTTAGSYVKNQINSATYYEGYGWFGTLTALDPQDLYMLKISEGCNLSLTGNVVDPTATPISLASGWNWVGYLPQTSLPINEALASISFTELDYIKDQTESAIYYDETGWFGNLTELNPGHGYMMNIASPGVLQYPAGSENSGKKALGQISTHKSNSAVSPHKFEFNATITARVYMEGNLVGSKEDLLYAYVDEECRGVVNGIYFAPDNAFVFPIMVYSNNLAGEVLKFKYYNASDGQLYETGESVLFEKDAVIADAFNSLTINAIASTTESTDKMESENVGLTLYPNPFGDQLSVFYSAGTSSKIKLELLDMTGRIVSLLESRDVTTGTYNYLWNAEGISAGTYFIRLTTDEEIVIKRAIHY